MTALPSISVIIPSFNHGRYIERTILSALNQAYGGSTQVIVADGGSADNTVDILRSYDGRIVWWSRPDRGFVDAVNQGIAHATGDLLAIQSSDDFYLKDAFAKVARAFALHPWAGFLSGGDVWIDDTGKITSYHTFSGVIDAKTILLGDPPLQHVTFVRTELVRAVGGLTSPTNANADYDLWYRIARLKSGRFIDELLSAYQEHPLQMTKTNRDYADAIEVMINNPQVPPIEPRYELTPEEKEDFLLFWKLHWTLQTDRDGAAAIAHEHISRAYSFSNRTRDLLLSIGRTSGLTPPQQPNIIRRLFTPRPSRPLVSKVRDFVRAKTGMVQRSQELLAKRVAELDLNWWQQPIDGRS